MNHKYNLQPENNNVLNISRKISTNTQNNQIPATTFGVSIPKEKQENAKENVVNINVNNEKQGENVNVIEKKTAEFQPQEKMNVTVVPDENNKTVSTVKN